MQRVFTYTRTAAGILTFADNNEIPSDGMKLWRTGWAGGGGGHSTKLRRARFPACSAVNLRRQILFFTGVTRTFILRSRFVRRRVNAGGGEHGVGLRVAACLQKRAAKLAPLTLS